MQIHIRPAAEIDRHAIGNVHRDAFPQNERQQIASLAENLLREATQPATIHLLAEMDGIVAGHIAFSPVAAGLDTKWQGYILAPLGVKTAYQKCGLGSELINTGIQKLANNGVDILFVYGDPAYYAKFGFNAQTAANFLPPYPLTYPFGWQAMGLNGDGVVGEAVQLSCVASLRNANLW